MTLMVDDIDDGATATLSITGYLMRILLATAPTEGIYYALGVMTFSSRAFSQATTGGMPLAEAQTVSYATYTIGNNSSTSDLTFAVEEGLMLLQIGGDTISDVHFQLRGT